MITKYKNLLNVFLLFIISLAAYFGIFRILMEVGFRYGESANKLSSSEALILKIVGGISYVFLLPGTILQRLNVITNDSNEMVISSVVYSLLAVAAFVFTIKRKPA